MTNTKTRVEPIDAETRITIFIPVYNACDAVRECLHSVQLSLPLNKSSIRLHIVDDASDDPDIPILLESAIQSFDVPVLLEKNSENLGFVKTVNKGLQACSGDIILLNSDTLVHGNWVDRLVEAASHSSDIATVTPFSNNATICSYPGFCEINEIDGPDQVAYYDRLFASANAGRVEEIPTGVGFCMLITRPSLDAFGLLNAGVFGKGYGEENDYCMRARDGGWKNVVACDVYVGHTGGESFGGEKRARIQAAMEALEKLHPGYHGLVHDFCQRDPLQKVRMRVWLHELMSQQELPLVCAVTHGWGGGSEKFLEMWFDRVRNRARVCYLRSNSTGKLRLHHPCSPTTGVDIVPRNAGDLLKRLGVVRLFLNQLVDVSEEAVASLLAKRIPFDVMLHDYYLLSGQPTVPSRETTAEAGRVSEALSKVVARAERAYAPSEACAQFFIREFPRANIVVAPHREPELGQVLSVQTSKKDGVFRVVVIGALSPEKGADTLDEVAILARQRNKSIEFVLMGYAYRDLSAWVLTTGRYEDEDARDLLNSLNADLVWFPAKWPESYSYTLSLAFELGLPVLAPSIGAFPERCSGRPLTWIYSSTAQPNEILIELERVCAEVRDSRGVSVDWQPRASSDVPSEFVGNAKASCDTKSMVDWDVVFELEEELFVSHERINLAGSAVLRLRQVKALKPLIGFIPAGLKYWMLKKSKLIA